MTAPSQNLTGNDYRVVFLDLGTVADAALVPGLTGSAIYAVTALELPAGAQFSLHFGRRQPVPISDRVSSFEFACGFTDGLYFSVPVAQPGSVVPLFVSFSPVSVGGN